MTQTEIEELIRKAREEKLWFTSYWRSQGEVWLPPSRIEEYLDDFGSAIMLIANWKLRDPRDKLEEYSSNINTMIGDIIEELDLKYACTDCEANTRPSLDEDCYICGKDDNVNAVYDTCGDYIEIPEKWQSKQEVE